MATREEYAKRSREERLARIAQTPGDLARAVSGQRDEALSRRPDEKNWAPKEVICHLRDNEQWFLIRLQKIMVVNEPRFITTNPNHEAEERAYLHNDPGAALREFSRWREETLQFFRRLQPGDWDRAGTHADSRGRRTIDEFLTVIAWHDDNHLDQLRRALG